jgi:hypothetical protein
VSAMGCPRRHVSKALIIIVEIGIFGLVLATVWLDEFVDLPQRLFNAAPTPYRLEEYLLESIMVAIVGIIVIAITWYLLNQLERVEKFVRICSWCRRVYLDDRWVRFEEYLQQDHRVQSTHGICEGCAQQVSAELSIQRNYKNNLPLSERQQSS